MHFCSDFHPKVQQNSNINIKSLIIIIELTIPKRQIEVRFLVGARDFLMPPAYAYMTNEISDSRYYRKAE